MDLAFPVWARSLNSPGHEKTGQYLSVAYLTDRIPGWGKDQHAFLFEVEADLFIKMKNSAASFLHPFILVPLIGQIILLYTLFQRKPGRILSFIALGCLSTLMVMILFVGVITTNVRIAGSAIPFLVTGILVLRYNRKKINGD